MKIDLDDVKMKINFSKYGAAIIETVSELAKEGIEPISDEYGIMKDNGDLDIMVDCSDGKSRKIYTFDFADWEFTKGGSK